MSTKTNRLDLPSVFIKKIDQSEIFVIFFFKNNLTENVINNERIVVPFQTFSENNLTITTPQFFLSLIFV